MWSRRALAAGTPPSQRLVTLCSSLGIYGPDFFPKEAGAGYTSTPYLDLIKDHRSQFSVFSGVSHPDQNGRDGHSSEMTWLTSARGPGLGGFRNSISVDQLAAETIGVQTRCPSLALNTGGSTSQSYTRSGVMIPAESKPSRVFSQLFLDGSAHEIQQQMRKLHEGRSIMDMVSSEAKRMQKTVGAADKDKLEEYFTSVREMEQRLQKAEEWVQKPKPKVTAQQPKDIQAENDLIGRMNLLFELVPLALQTDSTRLITILIQGRGDVPQIAGVKADHHNLSHHGQDAEKIAQLRLIEQAEFKAFNKLLTALKTKQEGAGNLLDSTMVMFGSNLGNANSHDWHNLPLLLAGGSFKHGQHIVGDEKNNIPMANLLLTCLQKLGVEADSFGSSQGTLTI
jgi:BMFP domain-containing protein YqiC